MSGIDEILGKLSDNLECQLLDPETKLLSLERQNAFYEELEAIPNLPHISFTVQKHPQNETYFIIARLRDGTEEMLRIGFTKKNELRSLVRILTTLFQSEKERILYISGKTNSRRFMYEGGEVILQDVRPDGSAQSYDIDKNNRYEEIARFLNKLKPEIITYGKSIRSSNPQEGCGNK